MIALRGEFQSVEFSFSYFEDAALLVFSFDLESDILNPLAIEIDAPLANHPFGLPPGGKDVLFNQKIDQGCGLGGDCHFFHLGGKVFVFENPFEFLGSPFRF